MMNNNKIPLVSVIVLTYNQEQTVVQTLDSILSQRATFDFEIIIGEDASPSDNTRAVCEAYAEQHPSIVRLMPKTPNKGLMRNYADCLKECKGKYIAGCAGDDWWHNDDKLQMQVDYLESHDNCVLVYTNYNIFQPKRNTTIRRALPAESLNPTGMIDKLMRGFFLPPLTILYRADALRYIDFEVFIERGYMAEDLPMFLEFSLHGDFACIDVSTATYRAEAGSISQFSDSKKAEHFLLNIKNIKLDFIAPHLELHTMTAQQVEIMYDRLIFIYAFSLCNRDMALSYAKKVGHCNRPIDKLKLVICKVKLLWSFYLLTRKVIKR